MRVSGAVAPPEVDAVRDAVNHPNRKRKKPHRRPMKISAMSPNERHPQKLHVCSVLFLCCAIDICDFTNFPFELQAAGVVRAGENQPNPNLRRNQKPRVTRAQ